LRSLPGLSADDGVTISAHDAQGYLVVATQTNDQLRELKEALRLID
jgi:nitrate reductase NapAB chaperone NapD